MRAQQVRELVGARVELSVAQHLAFTDGSDRLGCLGRTTGTLKSAPRTLHSTFVPDAIQGVQAGETALTDGHAKDDHTVVTRVLALGQSPGREPSHRSVASLNDPASPL